MRLLSLAQWFRVLEKGVKKCIRATILVCLFV